MHPRREIGISLIIFGFADIFRQMLYNNEGYIGIIMGILFVIIGIFVILYYFSVDKQKKKK